MENTIAPHHVRTIEYCIAAMENIWKVGQWQWKLGKDLWTYYLSKLLAIIIVENEKSVTDYLIIHKVLMNFIDHYNTFVRASFPDAKLFFDSSISDVTCPLVTGDGYITFKPLWIAEALAEVLLEAGITNASSHKIKITSVSLLDLVLLNTKGQFSDNQWKAIRTIKVLL